MRRMMAMLLCALLLGAPSLSIAAEANAQETFAWTLRLGASGMTSPSALIPASGGGAFIVGATDSEDDLLGTPLGGWDGFAVRVDEGGEVLWSRRLGGSADDRFTTAVEMPDGGLIVMGTTLSSDGQARAARGGVDAFLVYLDAQGELIWNKCLGGSGDDELTVLRRTEDGMLFACGRTQSRNGDLNSNYGGWDAWATLLSPDDGKPAWTYRYGYGGDDMFFQAHPAADGWLLLGEVGEETAVGDDGQPVYTGRPIAHMLSSGGEPLWETPRTLGDTGENLLFDINETATGWLLAGETNSRSALMPPLNGGKDIWVLHMRQQGTVAWQRAYGGSRDEHLRGIYALPSGGYLMLAETESSDMQVAIGAHGGRDVWLVNLLPSGLIQWQQPIGGGGDSYAVGLLLRADGGFIVAGTTNSQDGDIGRHNSVRTGFLAWLSSNGNLLGTMPVPGDQECALIQIAVEEGVGYLLGSIRDVSADGHTEDIWLARFAEEGFLYTQ